MEIVNTLYNSVADFYNTINPNTLSGASDIIVVRHRIKDIASNKIKYVYTCTPFHVRFGTLQMFRISMKTVHLIVNNRMTDIAMKIGRNGDLYFELEDSENEDGVEVYEDRAVLNIRMKDDGLIESGFLSDSAVCDGVCEARKIRHKLLKKSASKKMIDFTNDDKYKNSDHKDNPRNNSFYHQNSDHNDNLENKSFYYQNSSSEIITPYKISTIAVDSPSKHSLTTSTPPLEKSNPDLLTAPKFNLIRSQNYEIRSFMKNIRGFDADFYKRKYIFSSFKNFLVSLEHLDFIFKNYYRYEILVKNLLKIGINQSRECVERDFNKNKDSINDNPINNKYINNFRYCSPCKNDFTNTPCTSVSIRYSKCLNSILDGSPETVFENYLVRDIQKFNELIVEIKSCERCRIKFYLPFDLFSESVFLIQSFYSQDGCFRSTCEERGNESKLKCNYFKETKTNSKDTSKINQGKNIQNQHKNIQHNQNGKDCKQSQSPAKYNSRINSTTINKNSCMNSHKKSKLSATTRKNKFGKFLEKRFSITKNWFYAPEVKKIRKSFKLSSDQLERLDLKNGRNSVVFKVGGVDQQIEAFIYLYDGGINNYYKDHYNNDNNEFYKGEYNDNNEFYKGKYNDNNEFYKGKYNDNNEFYKGEYNKRLITNSYTSYNNSNKTNIDSSSTCIQAYNKHTDQSNGHTNKFVISDIDGTITKSDIMGHIYDMVGLDYTHRGIAQLYSCIEKNGYSFIYLSNRSISQYQRTRRYLSNIKQNGFRLPDGPIFLSPSGIFKTLYREVVDRRSEVFKIACLEEIKNVFNYQGNLDHGEWNNGSDKYYSINNTHVNSINNTHVNSINNTHDNSINNTIDNTSKDMKTNKTENKICLNHLSQTINPFFAGFGNKINDVITYKSLHIPLSKIFTVNQKGEVNLEFRNSLSSSYLDLNDFVNAMFPADKRGFIDDEVFNDFKYWRI